MVRCAEPRMAWRIMIHSPHLGRMHRSPLMQAHKLSHIGPYTDTFVCRIHLASVNDLNKHKSGTAAAEANLLTSHGNMIDTTQHKVMTTADKNCQEHRWSAARFESFLSIIAAHIFESGNLGKFICHQLDRSCY